MTTASSALRRDGKFFAVGSSLFMIFSLVIGAAVWAAQLTDLVEVEVEFGSVPFLALCLAAASALVGLIWGLFGAVAYMWSLSNEVT